MLAQAEQHENRLSLQIVDKILWLLSKPKRVKIAVGGRGSAKSTGVGDIMLMLCDHGERICCTREFQNSIDDSVHENLKLEIARLGLDDFEVKATEIDSPSGGHIFYKGLARNITSLKSIAGVKRLWIEEGESVSEKSLRVLTPSVRSHAASGDEDPPEIWITMNRGSSKDAVAKKYLSRAEKSLAKTGYYEDDLMMVVEVNHRDNPWFPPELEQERQDDLVNLPKAEYEHIWEGEYSDTVDNAIITPDWFDACVDAHIKLGFKAVGQERVAYDPADSGDEKAVAYSHGVVIKQVLSTPQGEIDTATDWATSHTNEWGADTFTWDADGMGMGLKRQIAQAFDGKPVRVEAFRGSEGPDNPDQIYERVTSEDVVILKEKTNKETFTNKRAQYYWILRDRMLKTWRAVTRGEMFSPDELISFSSDIEHIDLLRSELCRIPRKYVPSGRIQLMTKEDMKKMEIDSPNRGDAVMMLMRHVSVQRRRKKLEYDNSGVV